MVPYHHDAPNNRSIENIFRPQTARVEDTRPTTHHHNLLLRLRRRVGPPPGLRGASLLVVVAKVLLSTEMIAHASLFLVVVDLQSVDVILSSTTTKKVANVLTVRSFGSLQFVVRSFVCVCLVERLIGFGEPLHVRDS